MSNAPAAPVPCAIAVMPVSKKKNNILIGFIGISLKIVPQIIHFSCYLNFINYHPDRLSPS